MIKKFFSCGFVYLLFLVAFSSFVGANEFEYYGVLEQGGVLVGKVNENQRVYLNERELSLSEDHYFVAGFGRDADLRQVLSVESPSGKRKGVELLLKKRTYNVQRIEGVPQKTVTPSEESLERIRRETQLVRAARKHIFNRVDFLAPFELPSDGRVTGVYGSQRVYNGVPKRPHYGIDYAAPHGAPVKAPASGFVTLTHNDMYYSGGTLIVDHGLGLSSTFIHLSEILVEEGERVMQGQVIAKVGSGGRSTGPHLDWRMNWLDQRIDPALMMRLKLPQGF